MSANTQTRLDIYQAMGDRIAGYVFNHPDEARFLVDACPLPLWPEESGKIALAVLQAPERGTPLLEESIALAAGVLADRVHLVAAGAYGETLDEVLAMAEQMATLGFEFATKKIGADLAEGKLTREAAVAALHTIDLNAPVGSSTSSEIADEIIAELEGTDPAMCATGITPLDRATGGNPAGELTVFTARYNNAKSRTAQNRALGAASRGNEVLYVAAEGMRRAVAARMISMITAEIVMARDLRIAPLEMRTILNTRAFYRNSANRELRDLFDEAVAIWRKLPIKIMDASQGSRNLNRIRAEITKSIYERNTKLVIIDHMSELEIPGSDFDKSMASAAFMGDIQLIGLKAGLGAHYDIITQRNEEAVKQTVESDSPGVRGGGYIPAKGDNVFVVKQKELEDQHQYEVSIRAAKVREGGLGTDHLRMQDTTGLIVSYNNSRVANEAIQVLGSRFALMIKPEQEMLFGDK